MTLPPAGGGSWAALAHLLVAAFSGFTLHSGHRAVEARGISCVQATEAVEDLLEEVRILQAARSNCSCPEPDCPPPGPGASVAIDGWGLAGLLVVVVVSTVLLTLLVQRCCGRKTRAETPRGIRLRRNGGGFLQ